MHISIFDNLREIDDPNDLVRVARELYDPRLGSSDGFILQQRIILKEVAAQLGCIDEVIKLINQHAEACNAISEEMPEVRSSHKPDEIVDVCGNDFPARAEGFLSKDQELLELCRMDCKLNKYGAIDNKVGNYLVIMERDPMFSTLKKNELTMRAEFTDFNGNIRNWDDAHDAEGRGRVEDVYDVYNRQKYSDAFERFLLRHTYHPIKEVLEPIKWDGVTRIPDLLHKWMGAEDNEYTKEVSRLIFAGGIHRLYHPGCKFDDMPVLIGAQGAGKSTFVRWLAIDDRFFKELTTTDDKKGGELVEGSWIMEVSELLALTRTKEQEEVKAFLSRQKDCFRAAYGKFVGERPRTCVFIGTSNKDQFITDKTGGRRFYPVHCKNTGYDLFDHEDECREYIRQCWAEARENLGTEYMAPYPKREVQEFIKRAQEDAMEEDYRIGMIKAYLDGHQNDLICTVTLWKEALGIENKEPTRADQTQIGLIMKMFPEWEKHKRYQRTKYGQDRSWMYVGGGAPTCTTPNDFTPF